MDEIQMVKSARQGDEEAFRLLFEENKQKIFALAFKYTKNREDAEDILQETFIKAYHALDKFHLEENPSFSAWLYRIGINSSIDLIRKKNKMKQSSYDSDKIENISDKKNISDPEFSLQTQAVRDKLNSALAKLTARQRMIFILRHYQQLSTQEIAEYMKCSQGSVKKQLFRALATIKAHFKSLIPEKNHELQQV